MYRRDKAGNRAIKRNVITHKVSKKGRELHIRIVSPPPPSCTWLIHLMEKLSRDFETRARGNTS